MYNSLYEYFNDIQDLKLCKENNIPNHELFYLLLNAEDYSEYTKVILSKITHILKNTSLDYNNSTLLFQNNIVEINLEDFYKNNKFEYSDFSKNYTYSQKLPLQYAFFNWLSPMISIKNSCEACGGMLLQIHYKLFNKSKKNNNNSLVNKAVFINKQLFTAIYSLDFSDVASIQDYSFNLPNFLLSISKFSTILLPEILGANLCIMLLYTELFDEKINQYATELTEMAIKAINLYLNSLQNIDYEKNFKRINIGFNATQQIYREYIKKINLDITSCNQSTLENQVEAIFHKIGIHAYNQHSKGCMADKTINEWFNKESFNASELLQAFKKSKYIKPGNPENSPFIKYLTAAHGPMFRVFSDDELSIIFQWIEELSNNHTKKIIKTKFPLQQNFINLTNEENHLKNNKNIDIRKLYYQLINFDLYPQVFKTAKQYADKWLSFYREKYNSSKYSPPFHIYTHNRLKTWITQKHDIQVKSYKPLKGKPEQSRNEIIDNAIKLAPLIFIDGAWIRGFTNFELLNKNTGFFLYNTYLDELGNGFIDIHHGNIYKKLLKSMEVNLPDFRTEEFAYSDKFTTCDFKLPVFWLAISLYPKTYLPEILGLNLAMEISGVGGEYRKSSDTLKYYGYSAQFTELHNSIDNIATGHTAWAIKAIQNHMDEVLKLGGNEFIQFNWKRIWTGYLSLQIPKNTLLSTCLSVFKKKEFMI